MKQNIIVVWAHNLYVTVVWLKALLAHLPFICIEFIQIDIVYRWIRLRYLILLLYFLGLLFVWRSTTVFYGLIAVAVPHLRSVPRSIIVHQLLLGMSLFLVLTVFWLFLLIFDCYYANVIIFRWLASFYDVTKYRSLTRLSLIWKKVLTHIFLLAPIIYKVKLWTSWFRLLHRSAQWGWLLMLLLTLIWRTWIH